ncbi:radical SAM protein [Sphingomonas sp. LHG3443-2]|uniref:radical SAM protein n=1 Tax=Sphingomonas sp. LHG3443-2 TaxID=2804639 RepID=UPI003CF5C191
MIVLWRVSNHCNLACSFCAYDKRLSIPRVTADPTQVERFVDLLGEWQAERGRPVLLSWLGGEPLLWRSLSQLSERAEALGLDLSITTNGTTLGAPRVRAELIRRYREVTISIDGLADFHDAMRGWPGAFTKLSRNVPALIAERNQAGASLKVRVNVVLMRGNIAQFETLCRNLNDWGVDEISFNQLGGRDRPEFFPKNRLSSAEVAMLAALLPRLRTELGLKGTTLVGGPAYLERIADTVAGRPFPIEDCRVAETFLFVDEHGRVAPCSFTPEHFDLSIDDLRHPADLDALPARLRALQRARPSCDCADCPSTQQFDKFGMAA